jgi:uncharacterized protein
MKTKPIFLSAYWEYLIMYNYEVPAEILMPYLPKGTELDLYNGKAYASIVGFMFNKTKVFGIEWPFHRNFEEVNLRFYVKYFDGTKWKRGVNFISEIVPKPIIAYTANLLYNEHYKSMSMNHDIKIADTLLDINYQWKYKKEWNSMTVLAQNQPTLIQTDSEEEFIFEHYWGYNQLNKNTTIEYGVEHERWQVYPVKDFTLNCNIEALYGKVFVPFLTKNPHSVYLAKGSSVIVRKPNYIKLS